MKRFQKSVAIVLALIVLGPVKASFAQDQGTGAPQRTLTQIYREWAAAVEKAGKNPGPSQNARVDELRAEFEREADKAFDRANSTAELDKVDRLENEAEFLKSRTAYTNWKRAEERAKGPEGEEARAEAERYRKEYEDRRADIDAKKTLPKNFKTDTDRLKADTQAVRNVYDTLKAENIRIAGDIAVRNYTAKEMNALHEKYVPLQRKADGLKERIQSYERQVESESLRLEELKKDPKKNKDQIEATSRYLADREQKIATQKGALESLQKNDLDPVVKTWNAHDQQLKKMPTEEELTKRNQEIQLALNNILPSVVDKEASVREAEVRQQEAKAAQAPDAQLNRAKAAAEWDLKGDAVKAAQAKVEQDKANAEFDREADAKAKAKATAAGHATDAAKPNASGAPAASTANAAAQPGAKPTGTPAAATPEDARQKRIEAYSKSQKELEDSAKNKDQYVLDWIYLNARKDKADQKGIRGGEIPVRIEKGAYQCGGQIRTLVRQAILNEQAESVRDVTGMKARFNPKAKKLGQLEAGDVEGERTEKHLQFEVDFYERFRGGVVIRGSDSGEVSAEYKKDQGRLMIRAPKNGKACNLKGEIQNEIMAEVKDAVKTDPATLQTVVAGASTPAGAPSTGAVANAQVDDSVKLELTPKAPGSTLLGPPKFPSEGFSTSSTLSK